jgi:hypothetical protein
MVSLSFTQTLLLPEDCILSGGKAHKESSSRKHNQKAPEDMSFIREKTYTLPIWKCENIRFCTSILG